MFVIKEKGAQHYKNRTLFMTFLMSYTSESRFTGMG